MKKLVAVMTCHANRAKADAQRATWVKDVREQGDTDVVFFLGARHLGSDAERRDDEVWFDDVRDDYYGIPAKVRAICSWATEARYDAVAKCDDDVYVAPLRFAQLPLGADYIGRFRGPHGNYPAHFASGFFYWLSASSAFIVGREKDNGDWMDERFVANALALCGITGYNDPVSYMVCGPMVSGAEIVKRPILQSGTVFCEYRANQMQELHDALRYAKPVLNHPGLRQVPKVSIMRAQFDAKPVDKPPAHKVERFLYK